MSHVGSTSVGQVGSGQENGNMRNWLGYMHFLPLKIKKYAIATTYILILANIISPVSVTSRSASPIFHDF